MADPSPVDAPALDRDRHIALEQALNFRDIGGYETADAAPDAKPFYLVYLYKRGTFYPFAPLPNERRDNELELRVKAIVGADLPFEPDLSRWFPLWDTPVH